MKKSLLGLLLAVAMAVPALAQGMWVGGSVGYNSASIKDGGNTTTWQIVPELGFNLNEKWDLGLDLGYESSNSKAYTYRGVSVIAADGMKKMSAAIFVRYNAFSIGSVNVIAKGSIGYENAKFSDGSKDASLDSICVSIVPVVSYSINDKWSIDATLNFAELSFANVTGDVDADVQNFGFNLNDGSIANIGLSYHF